MEVTRPLKYILILSLAVTASCSYFPIERYEDADQLRKFSSPKEALVFLENRSEIANKLSKFEAQRKPKRNWFANLFRKKELVEEVKVYGIRASISMAPPAVDSSEESITNNQEANVDEGGLVKRIGNFLIVLRKGHLYSIEVGTELVKKDEISMQPEGWKHGAWYDELLVHGKKLVVIGYSYETENTEYVFFEIDDQGGFTRKGAYLVSSYDYFSNNNYAGRLVDGNLVVYIAGLQNWLDSDDSGLDLDSFSPLISKVEEDGKYQGSYPLFEDHVIYSPIISSHFLNMTTVAICPLSAEPFSCRAKSILGGRPAEYYASTEAFYFWMLGPQWNISYDSLDDNQLKNYVLSKNYDEWEDDKVSAIYQIPLGEQDVGVVKIKGEPIDQFSFKEKDNTLNLLGRETDEDYYWGEAGYEKGETYLMRIPLSDFQLGVSEYSPRAYKKISNDKSGLKLNRFVGNKLVYTSSIYEDDVYKSEIYILDINKPSNLTQLSITNADMLQLHPIGNNLLMISSDQYESTQYHTLNLGGLPFIADSYAEPDSELAESRSHGFFYKQYAYDGMFAIPALTLLDDRQKKVDGTYYYSESVADMLYTRIDADLNLYPAGILEGDKTTVWQKEEDCKMSCEDWYGSARPVFWGDRIFALLKYELIEGVQRGGMVEELSRIDIRE